uniref:Serine/threonine-protein kinase WNK4-like n=1 Tax=Phascolarctos cinereus TaxID=38626 RepID=A0A6P5JPZ6_PHACI|nr:serine/threonine-protein kinase WNK4-like [Phascolarctos cinereus]
MECLLRRVEENKADEAAAPVMTQQKERAVHPAGGQGWPAHFCIKSRILHIPVPSHPASLLTPSSPPWALASQLFITHNPASMGSEHFSGCSSSSPQRTPFPIPFSNLLTSTSLPKQRRPISRWPAPTPPKFQAHITSYVVGTSKTTSLQPHASDLPVLEVGSFLSSLTSNSMGFTSIFQAPRLPCHCPGPFPLPRPQLWYRLHLAIISHSQGLPSTHRPSSLYLSPPDQHLLLQGSSDRAPGLQISFSGCSKRKFSVCFLKPFRACPEPPLSTSNRMTACMNIL